MIHREKLRMARKMLTHQEKEAGVPPFLSKAWKLREKVRQVKELKIYHEVEKRKAKLKIKTKKNGK